jgi:hypothetical protein
MLARGEVITDVARLGDFVPREIDELLAIKRTGERQELEREHAAAWRVRLALAIDAVDSAWPTSVLPEHPPQAAIADVDAWLRGVRKKFWD